MVLLRGPNAYTHVHVCRVEYILLDNSLLRAILGIVHPHQPVAGNGKSCLGPVFRPFSNLHQYRFQIRLRLVDISAFSGQNKVAKMYPKYLLTRYYK